MRRCRGGLDNPGCRLRLRIAARGQRPASSAAAHRGSGGNCQPARARTGRQPTRADRIAGHSGPDLRGHRVHRAAFHHPRAAIAYLAAAYNNDDITAMHALTDPQAFTSLQAMRSSDADLQVTSCTPTPRGDYICTVRYHDPASGHHSGHQTAMLIAAPALNPGWYMYRFISGCD